MHTLRELTADEECGLNRRKQERQTTATECAFARESPPPFLSAWCCLLFRAAVKQSRQMRAHTANARAGLTAALCNASLAAATWACSADFSRSRAGTRWSSWSVCACQ